MLNGVVVSQHRTSPLPFSCRDGNRWLVGSVARWLVAHCSLGIRSACLGAAMRDEYDAAATTFDEFGPFKVDRDTIESLTISHLRTP